MASLISKASLLMVPSVYEDGTLYNVLPSGNKAPDETGNHNGYDQTRADFTFSRGSNLAATRVNANGLIEKGRENLLTYSKNLSSGGWTGSGCTSASVEDFEGGNNANELTSSSANGFWYQAFSSTGVNTISIYAKAGTGNVLRLRLDSSTSPQAYFDLSSGTITNQTNNIDATITAVSGADGWYRCTLTGNISSPNNVRIYPTQDTNVIVYKVQLENGLVATPYIETGATTATAGVLENTPRIDYSSGAGALLLEPQRVNLIPQSEPFSGGAWNIFDNATITSNYATSPEGLQNAAKIGSSGGNNDFIYDSISATIGQTYTTSFFVKNISSARTAWWGVNVSDGQIIWDGSSISSKSGTNVDYEYFGNGWYRVWQTSTATSSSPLIRFYSAYQLVGETLLYGLQVEQGSHVSSYVPTYGSAATRGADSCSVTGASDVIGQTEGTAYLEIMYNNGGDAGVDSSFFGLKNSAGTTYLNIYRLNSTLAFRFFNAGANQFFHTETPTNETLLKIAFAYKANDFALYINGVQEATDTSGSVAGMSEVHLAGFSVGDNIADNYKTILFKERLTNEELATLTTL